MGQFAESGEGTDVWGLGRDGTREGRDGEGCEGGRRDGAGTRLEKGALVEHSRADFCVPTFARLTAPPKCLSSRSSRTTRTSRGTRLSTAGVVVRLLFEPPAQRAQLTGTWHRRGKDRLLRAQASRVPGQEQVQLAQVQIGRSHHEQGHHRPGAFSLHPLAQPASPAVPSRASKLTSERLPLRSCTPSSRVTSFLPPPTHTSSPATVSSTVLPTGLPVRSFVPSLLSPFLNPFSRSPAYSTGLLAARRALTKLGLADKYEGQTEPDGSLQLTEAIEDGPRPFKAFLDVGLKRTSTGARVFGAMKGASDGGIFIPHSENRFPGYDPEAKELDAETLQRYIYGGECFFDLGARRRRGAGGMSFFSLVKARDR